jgi:cytochrome c-type biogenesis protein CcmH/NrfG
MKNKTNHNMRSLLLRYLRGELSDDERFELENGPLQTAGVRDTLEAIAKEKNMIPAIEEDFNEIGERWQQRSQISEAPGALRWQLMAAAAAILLLAVFTYGYYQSQAESRLYANYFDDGQVQEYLAVRGESNDKAELKSAMDTYQQGDYENSLLQFKALREQDPFDSQILLYTGLSAMQIGDYYTARLAFEQLLSLDVAAADRASARWYLALTYLQQEQIPQAKAELNWLAKNNTGELGAKAKALLADLD